MGLGFSLLIVASMYMMREVLAKHSLAEERVPRRQRCCAGCRRHDGPPGQDRLLE